MRHSLRQSQGLAIEGCQPILQWYISLESSLLCWPLGIVLCPPESTSVTWSGPFPTCLSGFLRPTERIGNSFSWEWIKNYFSRAAGKLGTSKWSFSVVLIFRRQTDELKKGCLSFLRYSLFPLIDMKTISKLSLLSSAHLHPLVNQPFKPFWIYWFIQNCGRQSLKNAVIYSQV